jgi:hypothetical protein
MHCLNLEKGQNVKNPNVESLKVDWKFEKDQVVESLLLNWSERWKWGGWSEHRKSERQKERQKSMFNVLVFLDAIGNIRTSKVLVHFLAKNTFDILILPMASKKIRTSKIEKINYLWRITYVYQGLWGVRLGSIRLG